MIVVMCSNCDFWSPDEPDCLCSYCKPGFSFCLVCRHYSYMTDNGIPGDTYIEEDDIHP